MNRPLKGRLILVVEDEPLIALDIMEAFEAAGARVLRTKKLEEALRLVEQPVMSAAVVDFGLGEDDSTALWGRLRERGIPFIHYSGYDDLIEAHDNEIVVSKPGNIQVLVHTIVGLLRSSAAPRPN